MKKMKKKGKKKIEKKFEKAEPDTKLQNEVNSLRNSVNALILKLETHEPILSELARLKEEGMQPKSVAVTGDGGGPKQVTAAATPNAPDQKSSMALLEFIKPFLTSESEKSDPLGELMLTSLKEDIEFSKALRGAIVQAMVGKTLGVPIGGKIKE